MSLQINSEIDVVVVGSSPFGLAEAIQYRHLGNKVVVLETTDKIGGAWAGEKACGIPDVDIGAHDCCLNEDNGEFLRRKFGIEVMPVSKGVVPVGGCAEMSRKMAAVAVRLGVVIQTRVIVRDVLCEQNQCIIRYAQTGINEGSVFVLQAQKVVKTQRATFPIFLIDYKTIITSPIEPHIKGHIYFIVNDPQGSKDFYIPLFSWTSYHRICNLTTLVSSLKADERMFIVECLTETREQLSKDLSSLSDRCDGVIAFLQRKKILSLEARRVACDFKTFPFSLNKTKDAFQNIQAVQTHLHIVDSAGINRLKDNWMKRAKEMPGYFTKMLFSIGLVQTKLSTPLTPLDRLVAHPLFESEALTSIGDFL